MNNALSSLTGKDGDFFPVNAQLAPVISADLVDLNEVVQQGIQMHQQKINDLQAIIRFNRLPQVCGDAGVITQLFIFIFNSIIHFPPAGTKLFIYIKCEKEGSDVMDMTLPQGIFHYLISVYTNITTDTAWQQLQGVHLAEAKESIYRLHGTFTYHSITNTGCLYNLKLPGK